MNGADTAWIIVATALVLFMTLPGLALFYGGLVRARNVLSVFMHCYAIACLMSVLWLALGYSIAFGGGDSGYWGGLDKIFLLNVTSDSLSGTLPEVLFFAFQMTFAIITPALIVGAYVERVGFAFVMAFSGLWMLLCYAPVVHWIWGGGMLSDGGILGAIGVKDFAGGIVVHETAGLAALVLAFFLGSRKNKTKPPHNPGYVMIGAAMLWVGWFGFNAGSAVAADSSASMAMLVTHISAAVGALTWMSIEWIKQGKATIIGIATGMVAGLATITPAAGSVGPAGALLIGVMAGYICFYATQAIKGYFHIDDSLDVFPVHGVGGILGIIMISFLGSPEGFLGSGASGIAEGGVWVQLKAQLLGITVIAAWTGLATYLIIRAISVFTDIRVSEDVESEGVDINEHNEQGYSF